RDLVIPEPCSLTGRAPRRSIAERVGGSSDGGERGDRLADEEKWDVSDFDAALARCGTLDEDVLGRPWPFRGRPMDVRYALYRTLEEAQEVYVRVSAGAHPGSCRILALAQPAFGGLRGLLAGLPGALLDQAPSTGEWPIREVSAPKLAVEERQGLPTRYAVDRTDADPKRIPDTRTPPTAPAPSAAAVGVV